MFEAGIVVGIALLATLAKMNWRWKLRVLSHSLMIDVFIFVGLLIIHWGTFSGVMVATIGAFVCSIILSVGRWPARAISNVANTFPAKYLSVTKPALHELQAPLRYACLVQAFCVCLTFSESDMGIRIKIDIDVCTTWTSKLH